MPPAPPFSLPAQQQSLRLRIVEMSFDEMISLGLGLLAPGVSYFATSAQDETRRPADEQ
jgi:hypothetical protein